MAIRITLECGHTSMLRARTTPEGYTHDWEVFVRGVDNADISHYVDKVVFQLHETFPKPKRVLKDAPYVVKESGYAGFVIPIYIYLKNKDEPKKIQIPYDLTFPQPNGPAINHVIRHTEIITNPADDFRRKLLKGGGVTISTSDESHDKSESKVVQMVGKPKLSGTDTKKHRPMEPRATSQFDELFGTPIKKVSPESKKIQEKANNHKSPPEKSDKVDKSSKSKYSPHKDSKKEKTEEKKDKKDKDVSKDRERTKDKVKRPLSPTAKSDYRSPAPKRPPSPQSKKQLSPHDPNIQKSSSPKIREKDHKKLVSDRDKHTEKSKDTVKPPEDLKTDKKKKKHKDDKESERKEKNRDKEKDKSKELKPPEKKSEKHERSEKSEKEKLPENRVVKDDKKSPKPTKDHERSSSKSRPEKSESEKSKDQKSEKDRQKHKHKKKDKKERSDDSREREKREKKEQKQKSSYEKETTPTIVPAANQLSTVLDDGQNRDSSDSVNSGEEDDQKSTMNMKNETESNRLVPDIRVTRPPSPSASSGKKSDKTKKDKSKSRSSEDRDSRKRKRRSDSKGDDDVPIKRDKISGFSPPLEPVSSSQSPVAVEMAANYTNNTVKENPNGDLHNKEAFETEQIAPDSTNNMLVESETDEPPVFSDDYVSQLKDLQQKIMTLQDNQELQRVVQVIAATGQYEITRKTFDFDLCALDRRTVQRLQQFFSAS